MKISLHHLALCAATLGASSAALAQPAAPASAPAPVCEAHVQGQPGKKFDLTELRVSKRCAQFTVHLLHTGKKPWQEAGHNWVLTRSIDTEAVIREGQRSGPERAWLSRGDARVLAATQMLSGGEHASVSFPVERLRKGEDYTYFCSFPTHAEPMRGKLVVVD